MPDTHFSRLVGSDSKWDSIVSQGHLFKLTTRQFTILISAFTFAFTFLVARLFRVFGLFIFCAFHRKRPHEPGMEQLRVAVVNSRTPFHALGESLSWRLIVIGRKRERRFALVWLTGAITFLLLGLGLPFILSLFPVADGYSGGSKCWYGPSDIDGTTDVFRAYLRLEHQIALSETDSMEYDYAGFDAHDVRHLGPADVVFKSSLCPPWANATCQDGDALGFRGQYTILPRDIGVGNLDGLNFTTSVTCYKVIDSEQELADLDLQQPRPIGLFYGPSTDIATSSHPNLTAKIFREQVYGQGYHILPLKMDELGAAAGSGPVEWTPREDLRHQCDISLLIYNLGAVYALEPGDDSMFATIPLSTSTSLARDWKDQNIENMTDWKGQQLFKSRWQTVSVICNTSYTLCDTINIPEESEYCLELGGWQKVRDFTTRLDNTSLTDNAPPSARNGFIYMMADIARYSGMKESAEAINGVLANDLLQVDAKVQRFLEQISGHRELTRLFLSTRTRFMLAARRAILVEWEKPMRLVGFHLEDIDGTVFGGASLSAMCKTTLIPDPDHKTTTAVPWIITACVWLAIVLLTYSAPVTRMLRWSGAENIKQSWSSKRASGLHHQLTRGNTQGITSEMKDLGSQSGQASRSPLLTPADPFKTASSIRAQVGEDEATLIGTTVGATEPRGYQSPRILLNHQLRRNE